VFVCLSVKNATSMHLLVYEYDLFCHIPYHKLYTPSIGPGVCVSWRNNADADEALFPQCDNAYTVDTAYVNTSWEARVITQKASRTMR